uniref:DH domain-containing protein n=1 Tax=Tetranychus urticae TaxID=32264 RepID=T1KIM4_TETUR
MFRNLISSSRRQLSTSGHIYRQIEWKVFVFTVILPNGSKQKLVGQCDETIRDLVTPLIDKSGVNQPCLRWIKNDALIDIDAKAYHLENEEIKLSEALINKTLGQDTRYGILEEIYLTEVDYQITLQSLKQVYVQPLRDSTYLNDNDLKILFNWIEPILSLSRQLQSEIIK